MDSSSTVTDEPSPPTPPPLLLPLLQGMGEESHACAAGTGDAVADESNESREATELLPPPLPQPFRSLSSVGVEGESVAAIVERGSTRRERSREEGQR